jgi:hypothetical protein
MRRIYFALSVLLLAAVAAQFYFAAVGAFAKPQDDSSFALHSLTGMMVIPALSVLATGAAALARAPGRLIALTILPFGLVIVQVLILVLGNAIGGATEDRSTPAALTILGLHALNGLAIMGVSGQILRRARMLTSPADS